MQLLTFCQYYYFAMVLTRHGGGTHQSTSQAIAVPAYVRKKALSPTRKTEYTRARMMGKSSDVKFGIWFSTWNVGSMSGNWGKISKTLTKRCVDIFRLHEVRWKGKEAKIIGNGFKSLLRRDCRAENGVGVIVANWLIRKVVGVERYNDRLIKVNIVIGM